MKGKTLQVFENKVFQVFGSKVVKRLHLFEKYSSPLISWWLSLFLQRLIVKEFLDEIDVGEKHSSAAVAAQI